MCMLRRVHVARSPSYPSYAICLSHWSIYIAYICAHYATRGKRCTYWDPPNYLYSTCPLSIRTLYMRTHAHFMLCCLYTILFDTIQREWHNIENISYTLTCIMMKMMMMMMWSYLCSTVLWNSVVAQRSNWVVVKFVNSLPARSFA